MQKDWLAVVTSLRILRISRGFNSIEFNIINALNVKCIPILKQVHISSMCVLCIGERRCKNLKSEFKIILDLF